MKPAILEQLVHDDPLPALLGDPLAWRRTHGRTNGKGGATLLYEREGKKLDIVAIELGRGEHTAPGIGPFSITGWREDPALACLSGLEIRHPGLVPVRYRPGKRCTFRLDGPNPLYVKAVADDRGQAIVRDARLLWLAHASGRIGFGVARPAGWLPGLRLVAHRAIPARPVAEQIWDKGGADLAKRMGAANASLALSDLQAPERYDYRWQVKRTAKYARRIAARLPEAGPLLEFIIWRLDAIEPGPADRPIHGAPHLQQWLGTADDLHLVDFDRFGMGDPELDAATFIAEMDFEANAQAPALARAYRSEFEGALALNSRLLEAYRLHKHVAKAQRLLTSIRIDPEARCLELLSATAARAGRLG